MSEPTLTLTTGWCVPAPVTRCPEHWKLSNTWITILVLCSTAKIILGPRQNSLRVAAGSFLTSLTVPDRSCIWELTCSCTVPPWCEPRVRMKQRVRAVGVRSELIRALPPSQRGILVADAVASQWMAGGTSFGELKPMSSKLAGALRVSEAKRHGKRARVADHLFGPGVQRTFPPATHIYTFYLQFTRMFDMGRLDVFRFANLWTHRPQRLGCVHGMVEACRAIAVDWCAPCELSAGNATFKFLPG